MIEKTAIVTGASGGIGSAVAEKLAENGYGVALSYNRDGESAERLADKIISGGGNAICVKADMRLPQETEALINTAAKCFGKIGLLVNNAGMSVTKLIQDTTEEEWNDIMSVNVGGMYRCCKSVIPFMLRNGGGSIVNISSVWGIYGASCETAYSASKAAVIGFTKALAKELGPSGIRVNCVAPGVIDTKMNAIHSAGIMNELADMTPLCRIGRPEEVAEAVLFLAGSGASFITGQILGADGGFTG